MPCACGKHLEPSSNTNWIAVLLHSLFREQKRAPHMNRKIRYRQDAQARYHALCLDHRDRLEATDGGREGVADLGSSVAGGDRWSLEYDTRFDEERAAVARCRIERATIHDQLRLVVTLSSFVETKIGSTMGMRRPPVRINDRNLIAAAGAIRDKATEHQAEFLKQGLHPDVLPALSAAIDRLAAARLARDKARALRLAAGESRREELGKGKQAIVRLQTIVIGTPGFDSNAVSAFRLAKRVGRSPAKEEAAAQPDPVPAPASKTA